MANNCKAVFVKSTTCCYKTTTETVVGLYGVAVPAFPTSSTKDSVHVVRYDDALVTYAYNGTAWIETTNTPITSSVVPGVLVDNGDGTYTWTDTATTFVIDTVDRVLSTVVYSAATQDFTFTWSNGDTTVVDLTGLLNVYSLLGGNNTVVTGNGVSIPWEVNGYGVADNSDGTFTVTLPDGVTTFLIDTNETVTNIVGNTYTNEAGTAQAIVQTVVNTVTGNNLTTTVNGVSSTSVALPADIVTTLAATLDTTNPLAPTLVITYVNEDGTNATQNVNLAALLDNTNTTYTVTNNNDGTITLVGSDGNNTLVDICAVVASGCPTTLTANVDGSFTFVGSNGTPVTIPAPASTVITSIDGSVTVSGLDLSVAHVVNLDGSITLNDGTVIPAPIAETVTTLTGTQATGKTIGTYTNEAAAVVDIKETITSFASITNGYQFTSEDGTVYPFTFTFDNSTPSAPQLLVNYGATIVATIPLNSYDVNITTTGGFTLNPVTDVITITETDGETHVIDLTPLRTTLTSVDNSVEIVPSVNPDGSTNYDLGVKAHTNQIETVPYTGTELPSIAGVNVGDTTDAQFTDGTIANYTYDGVAWVVDFVEAPVVSIVHSNETQAVPYTGTELPTTAGVNIGDTNTTQFSDGTVGNYTFDGSVWVLDFVDDTATAQRPWIKEGNTNETSATDVLSTDNIYHEGKVIIGATETVVPHQTFYDAQIDNGLRVHGPTRNTYDNYATNSVTLNVNPTTGNDFLEPREYVDNAGVFQTLNAAINYINNSSFTGLNTIVLTGTTALAPAILAAGSLFRGKQTNINANGEFININGTFNNYGQIALNWGTYTFTGNFLWRNFYNSGFYAWISTFNLSATNTTVHFLFRVGASGVFDYTTINFTGNNTSFAAMETSTSVNLFNPGFQTNGFTSCKLAKEPFNTYANSNTFTVNNAAWNNISAQGLDVTHCTIIYDNRYYHGFATLPTTITDQNLNVYSGNLKIYDVLKFDNNAAATVDVGVVWATSATNTLSLPEGVLMVKY